MHFAKFANLMEMEGGVTISRLGCEYFFQVFFFFFFFFFFLRGGGGF